MCQSCSVCWSLRLYELTLVLALLDSIVLDLAAVIGILHAWLELAVGEGTCETGEKLLGLLVGSWLAWRTGWSVRATWGYENESMRYHWHRSASRTRELRSRQHRRQRARG
jgi:hypothetical protein